ncbi:hypothetical protein Cgig2_026372 [Carnegiea gigantea]|uniref:K-box domain-containing protein n=1 Tax=Carnegiea gigantea TaxID=171969 RepID=A0A9Q1QHD1_9CARY|nr:hypothetical protein Cgig2_026372 [Carnegiea gigantea]
MCSCLPKTIERYNRTCNINNLHHHQDHHAIAAQTQSWCHEIALLESKCESLKQLQRQMLGEELGSLSLKDLQSLEKQLEGALARTRQRKVQLMNEQMEALRRSERKLGDLNKELKLKVGDTGHGFRPILDSNGCIPYLHPSQSAGYECDPAALQIGYKPEPVVLEIGYPLQYAASHDHQNEGPSNPNRNSLANDTTATFQQADWLL